MTSRFNLWGLMDPAATCCVLLPARIHRRGEERLRQTVGELIRQGVDTFLVEQSAAFDPSVRCLRQAVGEEGTLVVVTHLSQEAEVDWDALRADYVPPFSQVWNFDPQAKRVGAKIRRTVEAMLAGSGFLLCLLEPESLLVRTLGKIIRRQKHLRVFDLACPPEGRKGAEGEAPSEGK